MRYDTEEKRKRHLEQQKKWREANPKKYAESQKKWLEANPGRVKEIQRKSREKVKNDPEKNARRKSRVRENKKKPVARKTRLRGKLRYYKKTQDAMNSMRRWSDYEIALAFNRDLTDPQIADELGRSVQAVQMARIRYADRAPINWTPKGDQ